jgi:glycosyltransferase involved in cell wall biosynthesis
MLRTVAIVLHTLRQALAERLRAAWRAAAMRERKLRIGIDIRPFYEPLTGIGWYLYFLLQELAKHDDVELFLFGDARVTDLGPSLHAAIPANAHLCTFDLRGIPPSRLSRPFTAAAYVAWMKIVDPDVMFAANYFLPRLHAAVARRRVITVHDLTYKRFPELLQKETLHNLDAHMPRELARADAVICVSESTRSDLLAFYDVDPSRVFAIHSGLGRSSEPAPVDDLPARYLLFVSTIEPRKNLGVLLDAFAQLRADGYDGSLVVVGKVGWKSKEIEPRLREPGIVHLDYVDAARLATIYQRAEAFVFPSIYEGFGFPLLEAMAFGVPAIAARSSSLPEIGGDAALYFDDLAGLVSQLKRVTSDAALREELVARGRAQVAKFRWDACAEQTLAVFRSVSS